MENLKTTLDLPSTFGATLIEAFVACILYGLTTSQTYFYFSAYPNDPLSTKLLVFVVYLLDSLHTAFTSYTAYFYLISHYDSPAALVSVHWSIPAFVMVSNIVKIIVQSYFLRKISILSQRSYLWRILIILIGFVVFAHFGIAVETTVVIIRLKDFVKLPESKYYSATPLAISCILSNFLINGALVYHLRGHRSGFQRTDNIVKRLIIYAANRCLVISALEILEIIVYTSSTHSLWYLGIESLMSKLYANSLFVSLNSRQENSSTPGRHAKTTTSVHFSMLYPDDSALQSTNIDCELGVHASSTKIDHPPHSPVVRLSYHSNLPLLMRCVARLASFNATRREWVYEKEFSFTNECSDPLRVTGEQEQFVEPALLPAYEPIVTSQLQH